MKRDWDLVLQLLRDIEEVPAGETFRLRPETYPQHSETSLDEHLEMLVEDAGLIRGRVIRMMTGSPTVLVERLTWQGHDFLEAARVPGVWERVKDRLQEVGGGATFDLIMTLATSYAKQKLLGN